VRYAIVDLETTGGMAGRDRVIEVAIVLSDGRQVLESWSQLVDPGFRIPSWIVGLTGINDRMVAGAPSFHQVAEAVAERLEGALFVAHNLSFDWRFLVAEMREAGNPLLPSTPRLCTVKMGRALLPGHPSYSLGKICDSLGIRIEGRHRALGDALATAELLHRMLGAPGADQWLEERVEGVPGSDRRPTWASDENMAKAPMAPGLLWLRDEQGALLLVRSCADLQAELASQARQALKAKRGWRTQVAGCDFTECTTLLRAALEERAVAFRDRPAGNVVPRAASLEPQAAQLIWEEHVGADGLDFAVISQGRVAWGSLTASSTLDLSRVSVEEMQALASDSTGVPGTAGWLLTTSRRRGLHRRLL
jgi:DNA polymerase-3 subunit epsilon